MKNMKSYARIKEEPGNQGLMLYLLTLNLMINLMLKELSLGSKVNRYKVLR